MSIAIKTILHRGPNEETLPRKEIRRFEIEENVNGRLVYILKNRLVTHLTVLRSNFDPLYCLKFP
jgi:hypothetical protein